MPKRNANGFQFKSTPGSQLGVEHKFIPLSGMKSTDEGPGEVLGYRSIFGNVDEGGEVVIPGAFTDTIPAYVKSGFSTHSHDWAFKETIGYIMEAYEDATGLFVRTKFHGTPDAQAIRQKVKERLDDGKEVGFSFGYRVLDSETIFPKDYEKVLPQYLKKEDLAENLNKAKDFPRIRILKKLDVKEDSIVTAPMNLLAGATGIKGDENPNAERLLQDAKRAIEATIVERNTTHKDETPTERGEFIDASVKAAAAEYGVNEVALTEAVKASANPIVASGDGTSTSTDSEEPHAITDAEVGALKARVLELETEVAARPSVESKIGATISASNKKKLQQIHDNATAMESTVCTAAKSAVVVGAQVKGMYEDALAEMMEPTCWQIYYALMEVLDQIKELPSMVGEVSIDKSALVDEALTELFIRLRAAAITKIDEPEVEYIYWAAPPDSFKSLSSDLVSEPFDIHNLAVVTAVRELVTRSGAIKEAVEVLTDRANEKQEFRSNVDGRPISALARVRKAELDKGLKGASENVNAAVEKSQSLALLEPEDLSGKLRTEMLRTQRLHTHALAR